MNKKAVLVKVYHSYDSDAETDFSYYSSYQDAINARMIEILCHEENGDNDETFTEIVNKAESGEKLTYEEYEYVFDNYFYDDVNREKSEEDSEICYYEVELIYIREDNLHSGIDESELKSAYSQFDYDNIPEEDWDEDDEEDCE